MGVKPLDQATAKPLAPAPDATGAQAPASWDATCLNCGGAISAGGHFCPRCGQRAIPPYPTVKELANDAFQEISGWDGRFAQTFRTLLKRPGLLTLEWLNGHRARYMSPIRLYLICSLAYFVVAASAPNLRQGAGAVLETGGFRIGIFVPPGSDTTGGGVAGLTAEERAAAVADLKNEPGWLTPILIRAIEDPARFQRGLLAAMPRALFALLPVFAGILALFYRGRNYPEHLYFAIHLHALIFLALAVSELSKFTRNFAIASTVGIVAFLYICFYADFALRRVYGGKGFTTLAKGIGIAMLYAIVSVPVLFALVAWAAFNS